MFSISRGLAEAGLEVVTGDGQGIIRSGEMWTGLLKWLEEEVMRRALFARAEIHNALQLASADQGVEFIKRIHADRAKIPADR